MNRLVPFYCRVCGHVEWIEEGAALPDDYSCSLCGSPIAAMRPVDDESIAKQGLQAECLDDGLWCLRKVPRFSREWEHVSYAVAAPDGLILFDPPPVFSPGAVTALKQLGTPSTLILSHSDFVGTAQLWKDYFRLSVLMGVDTPLPGNRLDVDRRIEGTMSIEDRVSLFPIPGHSDGSIAMRSVSASGKQVLLAGDAIAVWNHPNGDTQVCIFEPPGSFGNVTKRELEQPTTTLCCCTGWLQDAEDAIVALLKTEEPSARPYLSETGGVWSNASTEGWVPFSALTRR